MKKRQLISVVLAVVMIIAILPLNTITAHADNIDDFYNTFRKKFSAILGDDSNDIVTLISILTAVSKSDYSTEVGTLIDSLTDEEKQILVNNGFIDDQSNDLKINEALKAANDILEGTNGAPKLIDILESMRLGLSTQSRNKILDAYSYLEAKLPREFVDKSFEKYGTTKDQKAGILLTMIMEIYTSGDAFVGAQNGQLRFFIPAGYIENANEALEKNVLPGYTPIQFKNSHERIIQAVLNIMNNNINQSSSNTKIQAEQLFRKMGLWDTTGGSFLSNEKAILSFKVKQQASSLTEYNGVIDETNRKILVSVESSFSLTDFWRSYELSPYATAGSYTNITQTATKWQAELTITAQNGTTAIYTITVRKPYNPGPIDITNPSPITVPFDAGDDIAAIEMDIDFGDGIPATMYVLIPISQEQTTLNITVSRPNDDRIKPNSNTFRAISIVIDRGPGVEAQQVILALPIPSGVINPGAFHFKDGTGRWEYRALTELIPNQMIIFETNLSVVAVAEAVEVPTITETTKTENSVTLKWTSSVSGGTYEIYKGTTLVGTTREKTYTVAGLSPSTTYIFKVRAVNSENFESAFAEKTETTSASPSSGGGGGGGGVPSSGTTVMITAGQSGTVKADGVTITLPTGAFGKDVKVTVKAVSSTSSLPMPSIMKLISQVFEITKDEAGKFDKPVTITLSFDKSKVDLEKYDLAIFWLDEEAKEWIQLDNVKVDLEKGTVSGDVDHFTKFAVLAVEKAVPAPIPTPIPVPKVELTDIKGHWAEASILKLVETGAISGYPDKTFKPNNNITRAEFATVLVKAFDLEAKTGKVFADTANHWAKDAIATAAAYGIVSGYSADTFGPNDLITREQMAAMIVKAAGLDTALTSKDFTDSQSISAWAVDAVNTAAEKEIISGYPDNSFRPQGKATRAEAVTVIVNALK